MKRTQRLLALLAVLFVVGMPQALADDALLNHAKDLATHLDSLANCHEYVEVMADSEEIAKLVEQWGEHPHDKLVAAYRMSISQKQVDLLLVLQGVDVTKLSQEVRGELRHRLLCAVPLYINSKTASTATMIAMSAALTTSTAIHTEGMTDGFLYLLLYEEAWPIMVSFCPGEEGVATATVHYLGIDLKEEEMNAMIDQFQKELDKASSLIEALVGDLTIEKIELAPQE